MTTTNPPSDGVARDLENAAKALKKQFVDDVSAITGWKADECRNFLNCLVSSSPEQLREDAAFAVEFAIKAERRAAIIDLMKTLGRALMVTVENGDLVVGFRDPQSTPLESAAALARASGEAS